MSNAAKHRKKAAEFEQLKQIDRAIASYVRAIEESEGAGEDVDVALFNKVGDLALRQGRVPDAITYYERAVEHYTTSGLFNNAIALCNKILRNAPGRANVYYTLGRICARKGLRGDAMRNFLEYATRMKQEGRVEEGMRALAEVADLMPELTEIQALVEEHAARAGIALPRRRTPIRAADAIAPAAVASGPRPAGLEDRTSNLVFLDVDYGDPRSRTPLATRRVPTPRDGPSIADQVDATADGAGDLPFLEVPERLDGLVDALAETGGDTDVWEVEPESSVDRPPAVEGVPVVALDGLELLPELADDMPPLLEGFTAERTGEEDDDSAPQPVTSDVTWLVPPDAEADLAPLDDMLVSEFDGPPAQDPFVIDVVDPVDPGEVGTFESLEVVPVPELDEAIAAGEALVAQAQLQPQTQTQAPSTPLVTRATFRLDPHDFVQIGELPPLVLSDALVEAGLQLAFTRAPIDEVAGAPDESDTSGTAEASSQSVAPAPARDAVSSEAAADWSAASDSLELVDLQSFGEPTEASGERIERPEDLSGPIADRAPAVDDSIDTDPWGADELELDTVWDPAADPVSDAADGDPVVHAANAGDVAMPSHDALAEAAGTRDLDTPIGSKGVHPTPTMATAAVAAEAVALATSRRDALRAAVSRLPQNWLLRRRLAESLFEAGERDAALHELETAQQGLINEGEFQSAAEIADELVQVAPDRVPYHQKRVELAVRLQNQDRLQLTYLDLADALVRMGEEARARAVYVRVLEIDPHDDRARAALGASAPPPPPPPPARSDDGFVDLADWLRDEDEPVSTRMRMREPVISGDEQADFEALLQHFKEGVSRSLGENDFEGHYDLGVAYKEMGLLDDAIAEFQKALRSRSHRLPAYEALGQCFVEQGRFQVAATVLSRALHEPGLDDDQRVGVLYLLAHSCDALQRREEARGYFQRVYATDINFRDVAARLAALDQATR